MQDTTVADMQWTFCGHKIKLLIKNINNDI